MKFLLERSSVVSVGEGEFFFREGDEAPIAVFGDIRAQSQTKQQGVQLLAMLREQRMNVVRRQIQAALLGHCFWQLRRFYR